MSDKTAIDKAREAIMEVLAKSVPLLTMALAALDAEKPAEKYCIRCGYAIPEDFHICTKCGLPVDAEKPTEENYMVLLDAIFDAIKENGIRTHPIKGMFLTSESIDACLPIIQQLAETYHSARCKECVGKLPAFPHRVDFEEPTV